MSHGARSQTQATEDTSTTMVEMASQIDSVARSTSTLADNVGSTSASIEEMSASIEQGARESENLLAAVEETSTTIEEMTSTIRAVADLDVDLGWVPRVHAGGITLANAPWGQDPHMVEIATLDASIDLRELLSGRVVLPSLVVRGPRVLLITRPR